MTIVNFSVYKLLQLATRGANATNYKNNILLHVTNVSYNSYCDQVNISGTLNSRNMFVTHFHPVSHVFRKRAKTDCCHDASLQALNSLFPVKYALQVEFPSGFWQELKILMLQRPGYILVRVLEPTYLSPRRLNFSLLLAPA